MPSTRPPTRASRIVLAEDDPSLRNLLASALEYDGHDVVQVSTGAELIEQVHRIVARGEEVDLIISDVRMPKLSGLVVLKLLRNTGFEKPVILITAFSDVWTKREAGQYNAVLLDKPVHLRALRGHVEKALKVEGP